MNYPYALVLLVPVAFVLGWWASRRMGAKRSGAEVSELSSDYFRGLNYLLNEEQDKARDLEAEVRLAEHKASWYDLGEALLQIGVIITSITLLTRRQVYWHLGTAFGVLGIVAASMAFIHPWVMHLFGHGS